MVAKPYPRARIFSTSNSVSRPRDSSDAGCRRCVFESQIVDSLIPGSLMTDWLPEKLRVRMIGTGLRPGRNVDEHILLRPVLVGRKVNGHLLANRLAAKRSLGAIKHLESCAFGRFWAVAVHTRRKEFDNLLSPAFPVTRATHRLAIVEDQRIGKSVGADF